MTLLDREIGMVVATRDSDGRWLFDTQYPGAMPGEMDAGEDQLGRWSTSRALRVLRWFGATPLPQDKDR